MAEGKKSPATREAASYTHPQADMPLCPEIGTQPQFKKTKPVQKYRCDSSLSPALEWDGQNSKREQGEVLVAEIVAHAESPGRCGKVVVSVNSAAARHGDITIS